MQIPFDVFSTCDADLLLQALVGGQSIESKNTPIRLALNISSEIICVVALPNADVCLGPFKASQLGVEEAVYDALHCLETRGLIEDFELRAPNSSEAAWKGKGLGVTLRARRSLVIPESPGKWIIWPNMKPEGEPEQ